MRGFGSKKTKIMITKERISITIDKRIWKQAKKLAKSERTNLSKLIEDLLFNKLNKQLK